MPEALRPAAEIRELLHDSSRWRLLGALFQKPVPAWHDEIHVLAHEVEDPELTAVAGGIFSASEAAYQELFGPSGPVAGHESEYRSSGDPNRLRAHLRGIYRAFHYFPRCEEAPDHISVEAAFVAFLRLKQAYATSTGESERLALTAETLFRFSTDHFTGFAEELSSKLEEAGSHYLSPVAGILRARARSLAVPVADDLATL